MNQPAHSGVDGVWVPCGTCWGQRRVYAPPPGGGRPTPHPCPTCLGLGERLTGGDQVPAPTPR